MPGVDLGHFLALSILETSAGVDRSHYHGTQVQDEDFQHPLGCSYSMLYTYIYIYTITY